MNKVNRVIYFLINILWAISLLLSLPYLFQSAGGHILAYVHALMFLAFIIIQFYGAYALFKKSYIIPLIATALFIVNFDFVGFKFITNTLIYLKTEVFVNGDFALNFQIDDPSAVINVGFKSFSFEMVGINILAILQVIGLIAEKNEHESKESYT